MDASVATKPQETAGATIRAAALAIGLSALPPIGQSLQGGSFAGVITQKDGTHCAVVLLDARPAKRMSWDAATAWAAEAGGTLPSRPVSALLFALLKPQFEAAWYWTNELDEEASESYAWYCGFLNGGQSFSTRSAEGRAVAVRLIPLIA